jgi:hypothetical protein
MAKLYVIAGHGAGDSGATGGGQTEAERVRYLATRLKALGGDSVEVLDTSRNWYADGGINSLQLPSGSMLIELHRDSATSATARGAHVIIKDGYNADDFDTKLAANLAAILPGRSSTIVKRSDLANVNRAAKRGINYRLAEVGFISSAQDREIFDSRTDEIAKAILSAAGISVSASTASNSSSAAATTTTTNSGSKIDTDGIWGKNTTLAFQKAFGTTQDGTVSSQSSYWYPSYKAVLTTGWEWVAPSSAKGSKLIKAVQTWAGVSNPDGKFGQQTAGAIMTKTGKSSLTDAIKEMQSRANSGTLK